MLQPTKLTIRSWSATAHDGEETFPLKDTVIEGTIVKKSKNNPTYMVRIMLPNGSEIEIDEWMSTEDLADPSSKTEKQKRLNEEKLRKSNNCEKSCMFL